MADESSETGRGAPSRRGTLVGVYLIAAALGYVLGAQGLLPFGWFGKPSASTSLGRVGFALRQETPNASPEAWAALRADVESVRLAWRSPDRAALREVLDLVFAVRGLDNAGNADWQKAERICRALQWPRCDRPALEELQRRSRP